MLAFTRGLSLFIVPFLLVAFALLYLFPGDTRRLFAWTTKPTMTPMVLGSAYLGGAYFFMRVVRERRWNAVKTGFLSVALFASLLGFGTILHWDRFNHQHVAFWLWAALYFTTPSSSSAPGSPTDGMPPRQVRTSPASAASPERLAA